jgi:hypothetical protein
MVGYTPVQYSSPHSITDFHFVIYNYKVTSGTVDGILINKTDLVIMESVSSQITDFLKLSSSSLQSFSLKLLLISTVNIRSAARNTARNTKILHA